MGLLGAACCLVDGSPVHPMAQRGSPLEPWPQAHPQEDLQFERNFSFRDAGTSVNGAFGGC